MHRKCYILRKRIFYIFILLLFALFLQGGWVRAQDVLIVPHDATSLTEEQKNSNPTILFYPLHMMGKMPEMRCHVEDPVPAPCETFNVNGVTFNMMCVEGGTFMMGSNDSSAPSNTRPAHPVTLSDFHIGQTEVTRALWRAVMDTVPGSGTDDIPVGHVTWEECQVFLTKLSEMTGKHFRLPTEAEWEYAARCGNKNKDFIYSGSDYADVVGWINYESNKIMPVAQKRCNQLGIYDMTGNSWEWCQDGGCRSYTTDSVINPIYVGASTGHVIRGGSFRTEPARCTNIARSTYGQNKGDSHISLRLVMDTVFPSPTPSKRIGIFSVSTDKQVSFSQGNLQYTQSKNQWRFAENQYDYIGEENVKDGELANRIDLFGWSGNNTTAPWGVSTSTNNADYAGEFVDWGVNEIQSDRANTWRTMLADEWEYMLEKRKNASNLYGVAKVAGENGLIILPDYWEAPEGIVFKAGLHSTQVNDFSAYQSFTADEWRLMEEAGAVFLHASGYRDGATVEKCNMSGYYWSNTTSNDDEAYRMYFYSYFLGPKDVHSKYRGRSVRLVYDTVRTYYYGLTDEQFAQATSVWNRSGMGWAIKDQSPIQGRMLYGIRMKVAQAGSFNMYKAPSLIEKSEDNLQLVATVTATETGLQDIDFVQPFYLGENEYLVVCRPSDASTTTLLGNHMTSNTMIQPFYRLVGTTNVALANISSLIIDFY